MDDGGLHPVPGKAEADSICPWQGQRAAAPQGRVLGYGGGSVSLAGSWGPAGPPGRLGGHWGMLGAGLRRLLGFLFGMGRRVLGRAPWCTGSPGRSALAWWEMRGRTAKPGLRRATISVCGQLPWLRGRPRPVSAAAVWLRSPRQRLFVWKLPSAKLFGASLQLWAGRRKACYRDRHPRPV